MIFYLGVSRFHSSQSLLVSALSLRSVLVELAEIQVLHHYEEGLLVKGGLRLHQLAVHPAQQAITARGEGIVHGLLNRVIGIPARAIQVGDRMADRTGDSGLGGQMTLQVIIRIIKGLLCIKGSAEERHRVMTAGAEARPLDVPVPLLHRLAGLPNREEIGGIVEGAEAMHAIGPARMGIGMALLAVLVHHPVSYTHLTLPPIYSV